MKLLDEGQAQIALLTTASNTRLTALRWSRSRFTTTVGSLSVELLGISAASNPRSIRVSVTPLSIEYNPLGRRSPQPAYSSNTRGTLAPPRVPAWTHVPPSMLAPSLRETASGAQQRIVKLRDRMPLVPTSVHAHPSRTVVLQVTSLSAVSNEEPEPVSSVSGDLPER